MKRYLLIALIFFCSFAVRGATGNHTEFPVGSSLVLGDPLSGRDLRMFGNGWKSAIFFGVTGQSRVLFSLESLSPDGGVVFDNPKTRMSVTGRYAVLSILRVGLVDSGPNGKPSVDSRQYCPVIDTTSGCILSNNTGDICAGGWDSRRDEWNASGPGDQSTQSMIDYQFFSVKRIWNDFSSARAKLYRYLLKDAIKDNLGVGNMLACEPISSENRATYREIANELKVEGAVGEGASLSKALSEFNERANNPYMVATIAKKTFLFDGPSLKSITKSYLVKGDSVKIINRQDGDWALIEYITKEGKIFTKWINAEALN